MDKKVIEHEPHNALFADNDGFECIHKLVSLFRSLSGYLIFEFGFQQQPQKFYDQKTSIRNTFL